MRKEQGTQVLTEFTTVKHWDNHSFDDGHSYLSAIPIKKGSDYYSNGYLVNNSVKAIQHLYAEGKAQPIRTINGDNPNNTTLEVGDLPYGSLIALEMEEVWQTGEYRTGVIAISVERDTKTQNERYLHLRADENNHFGYPAFPITVGETKHIRIDAEKPTHKLERIRKIELLTWGRPKLPEKPEEMRKGFLQRLRSR